MSRTITLGNRVRISDPCYGTKVWCSGELTNVKEGTYVVGAPKIDCGEWGQRVALLFAIHKDYSDIQLGTFEIADIDVGVDSGTAGIFDAEYYEQYHTENEADDDWYDEAGAVTFSQEQFGTIGGKGVVSSSGYGDGSYDCAVYRNSEGQIIGIAIIFITEGEDDE